MAEEAPAAEARHRLCSGRFPLKERSTEHGDDLDFDTHEISGSRPPYRAWLAHQVPSSWSRLAVEGCRGPRRLLGEHAVQGRERPIDSLHKHAAPDRTGTRHV